MMSSLRELVWRRANGHCEYCQIAQARSILPHALDHIISRMHGGPTSEENLCLACAQCNARKGTNLSGIDPATSKRVRLFHPRKDSWKDHFRWRGAVLEGQTEIGRATIAVLNINGQERLAIRAQIIQPGQGHEKFE